MTALGKPQTALNAGDVLEGGKLGIAGADYFIKVQRFRPLYFTKLAETTGDGDKSPFWDSDQYLYMDFVLQGWMVAGQAVGIANLVVPDANPVEAVITFNLTSSNKLKFTAMLERVMYDWDARSPYIGVAIIGKMHDTDPATATDIET